MTLPRISPQTNLITVDAGAHTGWARWYLARLVVCGLYDFAKAKMPPEYHVMHDGTETLVLEVPQWQQNDTPAKINNLFKCTQKGDYFAGRLRPAKVEHVNPHEWKGSVEKSIHNERVLNRLTPAETSIYKQYVERAVAPSLRNNVIDAIGLGLVVLGRW